MRIEIWLSTALFAMVSTGLYLLYTAKRGTYTKGEGRAAVQQNARVAMAQIVQGLRGAGYDPSGTLPRVPLPPNAALRAAQTTCLAFIGLIALGGAEASVQISYQYDTSTNTLTRQVDPWNSGLAAFPGGTFEPRLQAIQSLQCTYSDADGRALALSTQVAPQFCPPASTGPTPTPPQRSYEDRRRGRRAGFPLRAERSIPRGADEVNGLASDVDLRNR
jgi:hypothetical protein